MRNFFVAMGVLALGVALSGSVMAQGPSGHKRVLGYQDSETGEFHPLEKVVPEVTTAPTTGEFEVTFTITLKSTVPTGGSVLCSTIIEADVVSLTTATGTAYTESSNSVAKVTGTTATCTVNTPYSWVLPAASTTTEASLSGAYTVSIVPAPSSTISLAAVEGRSSASSFLSSKTIPATGTISKLNVAATL